MPRKPGPKAKKGPKKKRPPSGVSTAFLADMFGVTIQRISQLVAEGMPRAGRGMYPTRDCVRWYVEYLRGRQEERAKEGPTRTDIARDLDALKLKKALGEVFDRQEVFDTWTGAYARLGVALEMIPTKIGRELNLSGEDVKMIRDMIDEARARFVEDSGEFAQVPEAQPATAKDERARKTA